MAAITLSCLLPTPINAHASGPGSSVTGTPPPADLLRLDYSKERVRLTPGEQSSWDVDVILSPGLVDVLALDLTVPAMIPVTAVRSQDVFTVSVNGCTNPFTSIGCRGDTIVLLDPVGTAAKLVSERVVLQPFTVGVKDTLYLRVTVDWQTTGTSPTSTPGTSLPVHLSVTASSSDEKQTSEAQLTGTRLPTTGASISLAFFFATSAVSAGLIISSVARQRYRQPE
ncbi:hypothetical protein [Arthrobacter sp. CP30]